ncbi:hypothetical protein D6219_00440 [Coxiella burnetii]|nr:hypothetical protein D6219_00440 [Coxiella burnetii]PNT80588.1 hypothetical protein C2L92_03755 [Coxiella burnetii]PNT81833.1 hypothetical protein C2L91_03865 [Coxiella burnetii]PNT82751.1 hypothetical protein C2L93_09810 [Coxiella burnetii]PNT84664.1 hypothetical protein C2L90_03835 [Coxiella burnetii]
MIVLKNKISYRWASRAQPNLLKLSLMRQLLSIPWDTCQQQIATLHNRSPHFFSSNLFVLFVMIYYSLLLLTNWLYVVISRL